MSRLHVYLVAAFVGLAPQGCRTPKPSAPLPPPVRWKASEPLPPPAPPALKSRFYEDDFAPFTVTGTGAVEGSAFLRTRGGEIRTAAGVEILLIPGTGHTHEWYLRACYNEEEGLALDERVGDYTRRVIAGEGGRFRFASLPEGEYILLTEILWEVPRLGRDPKTTGGVAGANIYITAGQTLSVVVTDPQVNYGK